MDDDLIVERRGDVLWLQLNRPGRMNAYDRETVDEMIAALQDNVDARVGVITGTGRAFCAGGYLADPDFWELRSMFTRSLMLESFTYVGLRSNGVDEETHDRGPQSRRRRRVREESAS
jgi:enoyl-CoA hydratase/carnithine racemase